MRTALSHLPLRKRRELEWVVKVLLEEFDEARAFATSKWKKQARILKIILYGSYARDDWVDVPRYRSDFDLLVIVNDKRLTDQIEFWEKAEERLAYEYMRARNLKVPVSLIVHSLREVNASLVEGRYFFMDIARDGVVLYESDKRKLRRPRPKTPEQALALAREYFEDWYPSAGGFYDGYKDARARNNLKKAVFDLHQATERLYQCVLLVFTFYAPDSHNIEYLRNQAELSAPGLFEAWPRETRKLHARFTKLKEAYVKARYSMHYRITAEELAWLGERVDVLARLVHTVCAERIAELEGAAQ